MRNRVCLPAGNTTRTRREALDSPAAPMPRGELLVHEVRDVHGSHAGLDQVLFTRKVRYSQTPAELRPHTQHLEIVFMRTRVELVKIVRMLEGTRQKSERFLR